MQIINTTAIYLNCAANTRDDYFKLISDANFLNSKHIEQLQNKLAKLKLEIVNNPALLDKNYATYSEHYIAKNTTLATLVNELKLNNINDFITLNKTLIDQGHIQDLLKAKASSNNKKHINHRKTDLCSNNPQNKILPHILIHNQKVKQATSVGNCFLDPEDNCYEIFVMNQSVMLQENVHMVSGLEKIMH